MWILITELLMSFSLWCCHAILVEYQKRNEDNFSEQKKQQKFSFFFKKYTKSKKLPTNHQKIYQILDHIPNRNFAYQPPKNYTRFFKFGI